MFFFCAWLLPANIEAQPKLTRRVLIVNELGISSPAVEIMDHQIRAVLESSPFNAELYREYLETTLFPDPETQKQIWKECVDKYRDRMPDLIISIGAPPLRFLIASPGESFKGVPVVFGGLSGNQLATMKLDSRFTGVWDRVEPAEILTTALRLQPGTKHVVVVGGTDVFDLEIESWFHERLRSYESTLDFSYLTDLPMPQLLERLRRLPAHTVVLMTHIGRDAAGNHFVGASQADPMVVSAADAPVFGPSDVDLGHGEIGGYLESFALQGQMIGDMAVRILQGERPQDIPIVHGANIYIFDSRALRRWGLKEKNLPPGSVVLNRVPTVWEAFKWYIIGGFSLILLQASLIAGLLWQRAKRRKSEADLAIYYKRLHKSEEWLRLATQGAQLGLWYWDEVKKELLWDATTREMFGAPAEGEVTLENFFTALHPDDRDRVRDEWRHAFEQGLPYQLECRSLNPDGTIRWVQARGNGYYDNAGEPLSMVGVILDVTDRKLAEQRLRESQDRLSAIVSSAMDAIIAIDEEQRIVLFNTAAERIFGCTQQDAIGTSIDRFVPHRFRSEHASHIGRFADSDATPRSMRALWAVRSNGEEFPMDSTISYVKSMGKMLFTVILRDITERHRAETAIRESEERFRLVANSAPVMIWMSEPDKLCSYFNQPWLEFTGRTLYEELGNGWADGVHPEDLKRCLNIYTQSFDRRTPFRMEYRLRRNDGAYRWILDIGVPRFNPDRSFAGYIGSCLDITDIKLAQETLSSMSRRLIESQEQERTRIGRELHDDINQRLALLTVELDRLVQSGSTNGLHDTLQEFKRRVMEIGTDVQSLSHQLHSSKLEYLGLAAAAKSFCREISEMHHVQIDFTQNGVPRNLQKEVALCLFRVLQEALQNAVKYSGTDRFEVGLFGTSADINLRVRDWGRGFNVEDALQSKGLGLVSMRERVNLAKGEIAISSKPTGGTEITVNVPLPITERERGVTSGAA